MDKVLFSFSITTIAGFSTLIGTFLIFIKVKNHDKIIASSLAFASGVMITVSISDLIPESLTLLMKTQNTFPSIVICMIGVVIGIIFSMLIDTFLPDNFEKKQSPKLYRVGIISMLAIILHNIPEGIATFMTSSTNIKLGISLAIAISLHNVPEGISISIPIYYATKSKLKAILYTLISALSEPVGALIAFLFLSKFMTNNIMGLILSIIAGIMIHIAGYELIPTSVKYKHKKATLMFITLGILFMLMNHFIFN